jgi:GNAT superfamily N-acetyltransferase
MIRDATPGDLPAVQSVFERASLSNPGDRAALLDHPAALVYSWPDDPTSRCRVATDDAVGTLVGFVTTTRADDVLELVDLFVDPGRMRQGIARALLGDVVVYARATGARRLEVDGNPHAHAFYEAVGFVVESMVVTEFGPGLRLGRSL